MTAATSVATADTVIALTTPLDLLALRADQVGIAPANVIELQLHVAYDRDFGTRFYKATLHTSDSRGFLALLDALDLTVEPERDDTATVIYASGTLIDGTPVIVCCARAGVQAAAAVTA